MMKALGFIMIILVVNCSGRGEDHERQAMIHKFTNRLAKETSPYLQQHAHNPVEWYPWVEEAFQKAKEENKPIFLSIGYAACHWCHVMENESFEDEQTADLMNELFISIKVDREERPDVDQVYMSFVQMFTGSGGWPLSVFLTPDQIPFYGGAYFPPDDKYGRPGFKKLLTMTSDYYHNKKYQLQESITEIDRAFKHSLLEKSGQRIPNRKLFNQAVSQLTNYYDHKYGGIGKAPKFPANQALMLFLRRYHQDNDESYLDMVTQTLTRMRQGGIYDQIGGGFARYSVDEKWLAPHFEKMLYDNAQLAALYLDTYLATGDVFFKKTAEDILDFVTREMKSPQGGFYASFDADSEGEEGKFYLWDQQEIMHLLGVEKGTVFCRYFGVSSEGNFEGKNILHISAGIRELSKDFSKSEPEIYDIILEGKKQLFIERLNRIPPARDDKIILSWNSLMLSAYARAYQISPSSEYELIIRQTIEFIQKYMQNDTGLLHTYKDGKSDISAFIDDYAYLIQGLLDAYEALFEEEYMEWAITLTEQVHKHFEDEQDGGYFYTSDNQARLIQRMKDESDQSIPSATGIMILNQLRMHLITADPSLINRAEALLKKYSTMFVSNPYGYASYLNALDYYLSKPAEVFIVYRDEQPVDFLKSLFNMYDPNKMTMIFKEGQPPGFAPRSVVINRIAIDGKPSAYVCRDFSCSLPVNDIKSLKKLLSGSVSK